MSVQTKSNVPQSVVLKWNIVKAATEFGVSKDTLKKSLLRSRTPWSAGIMVSELSRSAKEDLLKDLGGIPLILRDLAHAQSRLPRRNGAHPEEVAGEG